MNLTKFKPSGIAACALLLFLQAGAAVTGSVEGPQGAMDISEGKVDGDKISFTVKLGPEDQGMNFRHAGSFAADEMKLEVKFEGGPEGGPAPMKLQRVK